MTPATLALILWAPFALTVLIAGLSHCIAGYRKGLWHALLRLGCVLVASVLSILLARLISSLAAASLSQTVAQSLLSGAENSFLPVETLVSAALGMVLAMPIFGLFMLILPGILRLIGKKVLGEKLETTDPKMKYFGLGVGVVSTLIFSLILWAPLYGTVGTATSVAQSVMNVQAEGDASAEELQAYLEELGGHMLVQVSTKGPVGLVSDHVSGVNLGGAPISVTKITDAVSKVTGIVDRINAAQTVEQSISAVKELVEVLRTDVVSQSWFRDVLKGAIGELKKMQMPEETLQLLQPVLNGSEKQVQETCIALLDFVSFALEGDTLEKLMEGESLGVLYSGSIIEEAGKLLNSTDMAVELKTVFLASAIGDKMNIEPAKAMELLKASGSRKFTDPAQQKQDAETILLATGLRPVTAAELIVRYPGLGMAGIDPFKAAGSFAAMLGAGEDQVKDVEKTLEKKPKKLEKVLGALEDCVGQSIDVEDLNDVIRKDLDIPIFGDNR